MEPYGKTVLDVFLRFTIAPIVFRLRGAVVDALTVFGIPRTLSNFMGTLLFMASYFGMPRMTFEQLTECFLGSAFLTTLGLLSTEAFAWGLASFFIVVFLRMNRGTIRYVWQSKILKMQADREDFEKSSLREIIGMVSFTCFFLFPAIINLPPAPFAGFLSIQPGSRGVFFYTFAYLLARAVAYTVYKENGIQLGLREPEEGR